MARVFLLIGLAAACLFCLPGRWKVLALAFALPAAFELGRAAR